MGWPISSAIGSIGWATELATLVTNQIVVSFFFDEVRLSSDIPTVLIVVQLWWACGDVFIREKKISLVSFACHAIEGHT